MYESRSNYGGEAPRPPPQPPPTFFICLMMIQKMYTCIHPSLIQLWKATIPCLPDCNCDLKSIPAPHLDEHYSAKNNHPCFPPPHLHQHYIVESDRKRPPLACLNVTAISNLSLLHICTSITVRKSNHGYILSPD